MENSDHEARPSGTTIQKRRPVVFYREADAPTLEEAGIMANKSSAVANAGLAKMYESGLAHGYVLKALFKSPEPNGFSLSYAWFKGNYELPPHKHNTDCLYYVVSGQIHIGNRTLGAGDGFFLPGGAGYSYVAGPDGVEVLEFRGCPEFDITVRDGSASAWERLSQICAANKDLWQSQLPPTRIAVESKKTT